MLHKWLFSGELSDPFSEFFVAVDPELAHLQYVQQSSGGQLAGDGGFAGIGTEPDDLAEREGGLKLWETKYQFQKQMLPAFVGEAFGRKVSIKSHCHPPIRVQYPLVLIIFHRSSQPERV